MAHWLHEYTVQGTGEFPFDMLRYDASFPRDTEDAVAIGLTRDSEGFCKPRTVRLVHYSPDRKWIPTEGRWRSFTWKTSDHSVFKR